MNEFIPCGEIPLTINKPFALVYACQIGATKITKKSLLTLSVNISLLLREGTNFLN